MPYLNLASLRLCTESEGPGKRTALWVQGCLRRCPGCCNPKMQEIRKNRIVDADDVIALISGANTKYQTEGITLLGGEPILQAEGMAYIVEWCRNHELSVILFTGYLYQELLEMDNSFVKILLENTDILVDGPFQQELYDTERDWIGSSNQRAYFLSDFYQSGIEFVSHERSMEINITDKELQINGWPFEST